jgi:CRISPR-associated protein Csx14
MTLPVRFQHGNLPPIALTHWTDGSGREPFKLYSGNRSAFTIAGRMLDGVRQLYSEQRDALIASPFEVMAPMGGSFNFDPRGAWTAIDAGYSLNDQKPKHLVLASHAVELLAAWGLEHARPTEIGVRRYRYAVWRTSLAPSLARPAFAGALEMFSQRHFVVNLNMSGKNKVMAFAEEETGL